MKKFLTAILFVFCFTIKVFACLNSDSYLLKNQSPLYEKFRSHTPQGHIFRPKEELRVIAVTLDSLYKKTNDIAYLSDKGMVLTVLGKYREAIAIFQSIEKTHPNRYSTASNMGTAYELAGDYEQALRWIEKAVKINPDSHSGSEWIHVNILKAKLSGNQTPGSNALLDTDFGDEDVPSTTLNKAQLKKLSDAILYQLNERMSFLKPTDYVTAQLLFDFGNIQVLQEEYLKARNVYTVAGYYGYTNPLIKQRIKSAENESKGIFIKKPVISKVYYVAIGLLSIIAILIFMWIRHRKTVLAN